MNLRLTSECRGVDWKALASILALGSLGTRDPAHLKRVFAGSHLACFAYDTGQLIGTGRAISDGVGSSAIYDVAVLPAFQGRGVGRAIMHYLLEHLPKRSVMLVSVPLKEGFYRKFGFRRLKTAMLRHENLEFWMSGGYIDE